MALLGYSFYSYQQSVATTVGTLKSQAAVEKPDRTQIVPPSNNVTVVSTQSTPRWEGKLVAFDPDGTLLYYNDSAESYWDIEPGYPGETTVAYAANYPGSQCGSDCTINTIERVNLSTGETSRLYEHVSTGSGTRRWHAIDRIDDTRYAVADIAEDRVFVVNISSGIITWEWTAQSHLRNAQRKSSGDWTHVNDVEAVSERVLMVSLRNQDRIVFVHRARGVLKNRTLGRDGDHEIIYEQHNPDYIPAANGGPAVLVADSENNRLVEYQWADGEWSRSWSWTDPTLQWPRDGDRLPDGNTLVTDSNGNRVLEVDRDGEVVWEIALFNPYEAERLGTGDESSGVETARSLGLETVSASESREGGSQSVKQRVKSAVPNKLMNAILFVLPPWMGFRDAVLTGVSSASAVTLVLFELRLRYRVVVSSLQTPVRIEIERK